VDTLEQLQARLFHLAYLAEELPAVTQDRDGGWIYRQIAREAMTVVKEATDYAVAYEAARIFLDTQGVLTAGPGTDPVTAAWSDESGTVVFDGGDDCPVWMGSVVDTVREWARTRPVPTPRGGGAR
jgi:hypothetical protein